MFTIQYKNLLNSSTLYKQNILNSTLYRNTLRKIKNNFFLMLRKLRINIL